MSDKKQQSKEVIKSFFLAFKRLSLYSLDHPLSKEILNILYKIFHALLEEESTVLLSVGMNSGEMFLNENVVESDSLGAAEIHEKFKSFKLDGVEFSAGLTTLELGDFVKALATAAMLDGGRQAPLPELLQEGSEHIKIRKIRYEKVEEDEKVVSNLVTGEGADGSAAGAEGAPVKDAFVLLKDFLSEKSGEVGGDTRAVLTELEHDVSKLGEAIIESARQTGDFEKVIRKFISWLAKHVVPVLIERKRDPSKFIQKLFDSFRKDEFKNSFHDVSQIIDDCADEIKMVMIQDALLSEKTSSKKALNLATKILGEEEDQKKIIPKLGDYLCGQGLEASEAQGFVEKLQQELAKDEEVSISKKKLDRLVKLSERFDDELMHRVETATQELTRANRRLSAEKERTEEVMRHLADGLVVVDKAGKIMMMNPAAEKLLGKGMKEALGKSLVENMESEHLLAVAKGPLDAGDETMLTREIELQSKDDETKRVLRASSAVVENEDGKTVGMVAVLSDITKQKEVEEMKSNFVSLVTHELRTPVVAIQKSLELILSKATGEINEDQEKFLSISKFNLERLNRLINDLLDMSKIEAGKLVLKPVEFDFNEVLKEVRSSLLSWANDKEIDFKLFLSDNPVLVTADRDRITQVLVNLAGNALKFTPAKGEVSISAEELGKIEGLYEEPCLRVTVSDSGIGIDPKDLQRIFNKFEQVSLVSPSGTGGSGLGLPIAKEIIALHGGEIKAESQKGQGSRFIFILPKAAKNGG